MPQDYRIVRGERKCTSCGREFQENETYCSALYDKGTEFERLDFCVDCWSGETPEMFSFWQTRVPPKAEKKKLLVDDEVIMDFFVRLQDATDELKVNFRYILALVLMRKKRLKFKDVRRTDDREFLVLDLPRNGGTYEVLNPDLTEDKISQVTEEIGKILNVQI